jgi:hypothetical protein
MQSRRRKHHGRLTGQVEDVDTTQAGGSGMKTLRAAGFLCLGMMLGTLLSAF